MPATLRENLDRRTVEDFGAEWSAFDQTRLSEQELELQFQGYFGIFPWSTLPAGAVGFDAGCGSGRWAKCVAPRVGRLHCVDASAEVIEVAQRNLAGTANCILHVASIDALPLDDESMDFGYSLGVLHHVPDPLEGLRRCVEKLKPNAPFLVYLYYALDNRPLWFRGLWRGTDAMRRLVCRLPFRAKLVTTTLIATVIYLPLARTALLLERLGQPCEQLPLATYRRRSFYSMRTDALDRFGTRLEHRFRRADVADMMARAGLGEVVFSDCAPYWCAVGRRIGD
ncbi:MAG: class I SAM-dependent methyltransferase [Solirubrobacterales bacterium]|nr:class I SAM-dependent methyltransferase [Solirubrobacterales bacterium]